MNEKVKYWLDLAKDDMGLLNIARRMARREKFSADWPKNAVNTLCIHEYFWTI